MGISLPFLETIKKAYDHDIFNDKNIQLELPVEISVVESYIELLKPAYLVNIGFQSNSGSIADVVPNILNLLNELKRLKKTTKHHDLCVSLINQIKHRFKYELNSPIYRVIKKHFYLLIF